MRRDGWYACGWILLLALVTGCSSQPDREDVEPAMTAAARAVVGPSATLRWEVSARCGPSDERLDGLHLRLTAAVPRGSVDLGRTADELRRTGLDVEVGDGADVPLRATASRSDWTLELRPRDDGAWELTAVADVDGDPGTTGVAVQPCG